MIDFSFVRNIDFSSTENIIFFCIIFILFLIIFCVVLFLLIKILKAIKNAVGSIFNLRQQNLTRQQKNKDSNLNINLYGKEGIDKNFAPKSSGEYFVASPVQAEKATKEKNDIAKLQKEKGQKDIEDALNVLKSGNSEEKETISSKMPSRVENQEIDDHEKIKIPRPKIFKQVETASNVQGPSVLSASKNAGDNKNAGNNISQNLEKFQKIAATSSSGVIRAPEPEKENEEISGSFFEKPDFVKNAPSPVENKNIDRSIFGGKDAVSRRDLSFRLRSGRGEIVGAQREAGLQLDRQQISGLVDKYFPSYYGRDISKSEFAKQLTIVSKRPISDPAKRLQTKREINLLKKIGGIK
jgi:hypothetical protein